MKTSKFPKKTFTPGIPFILGLLLGFFIACFYISRNHVIVHDSSIHTPAQQYLELTRPRKLTPLVEAGPFFLAFNKTNHDYLILNTKERQPLVEQKTVGDIKTCDFFAKEMEVDFSIEYDKGTTKIRQMVVNIGGIGTPSKYRYCDKDGDGQFDLFYDFIEGVLYKRNGLQWVKFRDIPKAK